MILTKAYITEIPEDGDNHFKVRIPMYEDNTSGESEFDALLCADPMSYRGYRVGDCVYVHFEDDKQNIAVILGKLFVDIPDKNTSYVLANELKVTDHAYLPPNTRFGDYTADDFTNLYNLAASGLGGGVDESLLKKYVKWVPTERDSEDDYYADRVQVMTGEEYDALWTSEGLAENDEDELNATLFFLTTVPPSEKEKFYASV